MVATDLVTASYPINDTGMRVKCALFDGDHSKCLVIIGLRRAMSILSIIGCLFVILLIWAFRKYVALAQRLILYLSITGLFYGISFMVGDEYDAGDLCTLQAFGNNLFNWAMLLWVCCITFNLYMNAIWMRRTETFEWAYCLVGVGIPVVISCLPFVGNHYGPAGPWCWIVNNWGWRFGIWYLPLFCLIFVMICAYIHIIIVVNRQLMSWGGSDSAATEQRKSQLKLDIKLLRRYPLIYMCCSIFALINRIQNSVDPDNPIFALMVLHAMTSPLAGMLNAVVFCLDKDTASKLTWVQIKLALHTKTIRRIPSQPREYRPYANDQTQPGITAQMEDTDRHIDSPDRHMECPDRQMDAPDRQMECSERQMEYPDRHLECPDRQMESPDRQTKYPYQQMEGANRQTECPDRHMEGADRQTECPDRQIDSHDRRMECVDRQMDSLHRHTECPDRQMDSHDNSMSQSSPSDGNDMY